MTSGDGSATAGLTLVFVVVTLLVALGIAAAQGCQGPARGLGGNERPGGVSQARADSVRDGAIGGDSGGAHGAGHRSAGGPAGPSAPAA
ncbi:protein kinase [Streptomyces californicus]